MTVFVITLPSLETRYTRQWYQWAVQYLVEKKRRDILVMGNPEGFSLRNTEFLDYRDYVAYVLPQIQATVKLVKSGDTVFFMDGETPGAEAFEYLRKMEGIDIQIRSYWHAGTYDRFDLTFQRGVKGEYFERGLFDMTDTVFVGSEYHKKLLVKERGVDEQKVVVTGSAMNMDLFSDGQKTAKTRDFLFAGRKVWEKGYDVILNLQSQEVPITVSLDMGWDKNTFYKELAATRLLVHPARQETFGMSVMEALASNVPVMVPNTPEFETVVPEQYRVEPETFDEPYLFTKAANAIMASAGNEREIVKRYDYRIVMDRWFQL